MDSQGSSGPMAGTGIASGPAPASAPVSPLRTNKNPSNTFRGYGSIFRSAKSCANLEGMNTTTHTLENEPSQPMNESSGGFLSRALFKSVRSCINLEGMDKSTANQQQQAVIPEQNNDNSSGILFSSLKGFKVKTNMVSERDINLLAPMSS